jgi:hypothetical protein
MISFFVHKIETHTYLAKDNTIIENVTPFSTEAHGVS